MGVYQRKGRNFCIGISRATNFTSARLKSRSSWEITHPDEAREYLLTNVPTILSTKTDWCAITVHFASTDREFQYRTEEWLAGFTSTSSSQHALEEKGGWGHYLVTGVKLRSSNSWATQIWGMLGLSDHVLLPCHSKISWYHGDCVFRDRWQMEKVLKSGKVISRISAIRVQPSSKCFLLCAESKGTSLPIFYVEISLQRPKTIHDIILSLHLICTYV